MLPTESATRKRDRIVVLRRATFLRLLAAGAACLVLGVLGLALAGWEVHVLASETAAARRASLAASHANSLRLVRGSLELQLELEAQEDRERDAMQLYLHLDRERIPALQRSVQAALAGGGSEIPRSVSELLHNFARETSAQAREMLDGLDRQGSAHRHRAHDLAAEVRL